MLETHRFAHGLGAGICGRAAGWCRGGACANCLRGIGCGGIWLFLKCWSDFFFVGCELCLLDCLFLLRF